MSTRSNIGILNADDTVTFVYCHFDGHLAQVGKRLLENYTTEEQVRALLAPGDMSSCYERCDAPEGHSYRNRAKGHTVYYGRDRGEHESDVEARTAPIAEAEAAMDNAYAYVFRYGAWTYRDNHDGNGWLPLTSDAIASE